MCRIENFHIHTADGESYYIREILDLGSDEYRTSKLTSEHRYRIIQALGLDQLTYVLGQAFRANNKPYSAERTAKLTYIILTQELGR